VAESIEKKKPTASILLVEDNDGDVRLVEKCLQARAISYELIRFEDGEQAIREISADPTLVPDLILLDLNLPRKDGFDVLGKVRMIPRLMGVPIGVLTSSNATRDRSRTSLIGVDRYIYKPPVLEQFIQEVGKAVEALLLLGTDRKRLSGTD
jgi:two-component system, chemotaxis family, response regulator Rcp1